MAKSTSESPTQLQPKEMADQYELVCGIYDLHKTLRMNALYYGKQLCYQQRWNFWLEIAVAIFTSATIGSVAVLKPLMPFFAAIAAVLGVIKPILGIPKKIERLSKMWSGYIDLSLKTGRMVKYIQAYQNVTPEMIKLRETIEDQFDELSKRDDPYPDLKLLNKQKAAAEAELPASSLWAPCVPATT